MATKSFKEECQSWLSKYKEKGGKTTCYTCPKCNKEIETIMPEESEVDSRGYWDSMKTCYECEKPSFVKVFPNGNVEIVNLKPAQNVQ